MFYSKTYKQWLAVATDLLATYAGPPISSPVVADVLLAIPRSKTSALVVPVGDGDNYEKAVFDMIQKKGYLADDKWITTGHWRKRFLPHGTVGFTRISLTAETEEIDIEPTD